VRLAVAALLASACVSRVAIEHWPADALLVPRLRAMIASGVRAVERFFGAPFPRLFAVKVFPDRPVLTRFWRIAWKEPSFEPACWMVASGIADSLSLLSPRAWRTQACEHDPRDEEAMRKLLVHELVHVYHAQHNPRPTMAGLEALGWFAEGLAAYVASQDDARRRAAVRAAVRAGRFPTRLVDFWTGKHRYAFSASLVAHVDRTRGRTSVRRILRAVSNQEALRILRTAESELIREWQAATRSR
jgi:hypothetical protein